MLRVLALLTYLAVLLVPLTLAQAQPTCAAAAAAPHAMTVEAANPDDQTPIPTHDCVTDVCKQMCSAVAILPSVQPNASRVAVILPPLRPSDSLLASQLHSPSERPPKTSV
jgi:hypothetical protein